MAAKKEKGFDVAKLQTMVAPITVRVEKIKGNGRHPIEIPGKDGAAPGGGLEIEDVLKLENFIANEWSGGGSYEATATDSLGNSMVWAFNYDPRTYPERPIPGGAPVAAPATLPMPPVAPQLPVAYPGGFGTQPLAASPVPVVAAPAPTARPIGSASMSWPPQAVYPVQSAQPMSNNFLQTPNFVPFAAPASGAEERARASEERTRQLELTIKEQEYRAALERQQAAHEKSLSDMREEMRRMHEAKPVGEPPELKALKDELERQKQAAIDAKLSALQEALLKLAEAPKTNPQADEIRLLKEEMARRDEQHQRERAEERHRQEMQALQQQIAAIAAQPKGPDPIVEFMKENSRQQLEAQREQARIQQLQIERISNMMMNPVDALKLAKEQQTNADQLVSGLANSFGSVLNVFKQAMETMAQATTPPSNTTTDLIQQVAERASDVANNYFGSKAAEAQAQAKVRAAEAKVKSEALAAQRAAVEAARAAAQPQSGELSGAPVTNGNGNGKHDSSDAGPRPPRRSEAEERVFFGHSEIYNAIQTLRKSVDEGKLDPGQAAHAVLTGVGQVQAAGMKIPAFDLFLEGKLDDFVMGLLPDAPREFQTRLVVEILKRVEGDGDDDEDDGEDVDMADAQ